MMHSIKAWLLLVLSVLFLLAGCRQSPQEGMALTAPKRELSIAAAANLRNVLEEMRLQFSKENPDVAIRLTFGSSGMLTQQIISGAPFDLFLAANTGFPQKVVESGKAYGQGTVYCYGRVVMWSATLDVSKGLGLVGDPAVKKIAIANPKLAPYGSNTVTALEKAGLYAGIKEKIVWGENINQAAQFAVSANADIGFTALSLALDSNMSAKGNYYILAPGESSPIAQAGVVLRGKNRAAAALFLDFIRSSQADGLWRKYGYLPAKR